MNKRAFGLGSLVLVLKKQDQGPKAQDPRPKTQDPRPKTT